MKWRGFGATPDEAARLRPVVIDEREGSMTRWLPRAGALVSALAGLLSVHATTPQAQGPQLIAHYPLAGDLNDATGRNPPIQARNAPFQPVKGIFCNGLYGRDVADACDVRTPNLKGLTLSGFTISAQFLIPQTWIPHNPVGGPLSRRLSDTRPGGVG